MPEGAVEAPRDVELLDGLDPFGDDSNLKVLCEPSHGLHERHRIAARAHAGDEGPVDLQDVDGELEEACQRRVAGAKVVHVELNSELAEPRERVERGRRVMHDLGFGQRALLRGTRQDHARRVRWHRVIAARERGQPGPLLVVAAAAHLYDPLMVNPHAEPPRIVDPLTDFAFKRLLGREESAPLLVDFLNAILRLPQPVVAVHLENPVHEREFPDDRSFVVDIRATDQQGRIFHIDVQLIAHTALAERVLFCWADGFARQLSRGNAYDELRPLISIWVTPAAWLDGTHHHSRFRPADLVQGTVLTDRMEIHVLELAKWRDIVSADVTHEDGWLAFLRDGKEWESLPSRYESQKELTMAMKVLRDIRDREWDLYSRQLDAWRTQQLIEADRQREAEHARKLARDLEETKAALGETKAALGESNSALGDAKAARDHAEERARAAEAALAQLLADLRKE